MRSFDYKRALRTTLLTFLDLVQTVLLFALLQDEDYGGWPGDLAEIPIKSMTDEHKAMLIYKCSSRKKVLMPKFPDESVPEDEDLFTREIASPGNANAKTNVVTPHTATAIRKNHKQGTANVDAVENSEPHPSHRDDDDESDAEEEEESWVLKKVMSIEELVGSTIKCSEEECMLAGACLYVSNKGEKWYGCLDCQVRKTQQGTLSHSQ